MKTIIQWAKKNAKVTHDGESMLIGRFKDKAFRVFKKEGWVAVSNVKNERVSWKNFVGCNDLKQFLEALV